MLPNAAFTPDDAIRILRRRIWLIFVPAALAAAAVAWYAKGLPDFFRSETVVLVVPQRVPAAYVQQVTSPIEDRLQAIRPTIMSRTRLETIIQELDLYPAERRQLVMQDVVEIMRGAIETQVLGDDAFVVAYTGREPEKVMLVTNRLAELFVEESVRDRLALSEDTDQFLEDALEDARLRLQQQEAALAEYKRRHAGELPNQLGSNLQQAATAQSQVQSIVDSTNRLLERRLLLEQQLAALMVPGSEVNADVGEGQDGGSTAAQLAQAQQELISLEARLREGHPDLDLQRRQIRQLEEQLRIEQGNPADVAPAEALRRQYIADLQFQIQEVDEQIARARADEATLREVAAAAQRRADSLPTRETELTELTRDYEVIQNTYNGLLAKQQEARIAADLERRQIGEQFEVLDPAPLPERPFSPNRMEMLVQGVGAGFAFGLAFVGLLEYRDRTFRTDAEVVSVLKLPVLAVVPLMRSDQERRRARRRAWLVNMGLGGLVCACLTVVAYALF